VDQAVILERHDSASLPKPREMTALMLHRLVSAATNTKIVDL
jgi:hypothetical protein